MAETPLADAMVLFGATGDLSRRMVMPSLYFLDADGFLPDGFRVAGDRARRPDPRGVPRARCWRP